MQDELIIKYIKEKNEKGMELLINSYRNLITSIVRKHLGTLINYEDECVDDVFLSIWDNIKKFDSNKNSFKNWICVIAKYKSIDYKRKYISKLDIVSLDNEKYLIDKDQLNSEIKEDIDELLSSLSDKDKKLFIKYYIDGEDLIELAKKDSKKISNLYNRLSRGRKKIRESLTK